jgi:glycosyltransferase involved in cell wall biosynthesis
MRVAFDLTPVLMQRHSGFHSFGVGLLHGFEALGPDGGLEMKLFCEARFQAEARAVTAGLSDWATLCLTRFRTRHLQVLWRRFSAPSLQRFVGGFQLYHCFHHLMPPTAGRPRLMVVHDLRRYVLPELYPRSDTRPFEEAVRKADRFIAVSEATRADLCRLFSVDAERVDVVPLAPRREAALQPPAGEAEKQALRARLMNELGARCDRYVLALSARDPRKNVTAAVEAFRRARPRLRGDTRLVVVGPAPRDGAGPESSSAGASEEVLFAGAVDEIGPWLQAADALLFPSLYEGFGMPVLEAFACGTPVIASDRSATAEVAGEAAVLADPDDPDALADGLVTLLEDEPTRERCVRAGLERVRVFDWRRTAERTRAVYRTMMAESRDL